MKTIYVLARHFCENHKIINFSYFISAIKYLSLFLEISIPFKCYLMAFFTFSNFFQCNRPEIIQVFLTMLPLFF
jgi:hypothetical protein